MRSIFPPVKSKPKFPIDFSLAYIAVLILEISIATTELTKLYPESKSDVVSVRVLHTAFLLIFTYLTKKIIYLLKKQTAGYWQLMVIGAWIALPSLVIRVFLMQTFDLLDGRLAIEYFIQQTPIFLLQAFFWVPVVIILGGQRSAIFAAFKSYEKRLVIQTRINFRTSKDFELLKIQVDQNAKDELNLHSHQLLSQLESGDNKNLTLSERNGILQGYLKGSNLRSLSLSLTQKSEAAESNSKFTQNIQSLSLLSRQFNILYNFVARKSPLSPWIYTVISFAIIVPNYANFFTPTEILLSAPSLFLTTHLCAILSNKVLKTGGKFAILQSNLLIFLIGFLPYIEMQISELISFNPQTDFPDLIIGVIYPISYFIYIRFIQITQPQAVISISADELYASPALKKAISDIVGNEFKQSISHQWATYIHGKILTRLAATSLKLEQAVAANDGDGFENGLKSIKFILDNPTKEFEQNYVDLKSEISSRLDPWEGLISITVNIDPALESVANSRVKDLGEAIEEVISNSVRHGGSQNIFIKITSNSHPDIKLIVEDDAINPIPSVPSRIGLGTKILNLVSDGRWSINRFDKKTTVNLTMSLFEEELR